MVHSLVRICTSQTCSSSALRNRLLFAMQCAKCLENLGISDGEFVLCSGCDNRYHFDKCSGIKKATFAAKSSESRLSWRCAKCKEGKKSGQNTPSFDQPNTFVFSDLTKILAEQTASFKLLSEELRSFKEDVSTEIKNLKVTVATLKEESAAKDRRIEDLNVQLQSIDQYWRHKNFELINIEEKEGEIIEDLVVALASKLDIQLDKSDIEAAHRLYSRDLTKPSRIIVQLVSRKKREEFFSKKRLVVTSKQLTQGTSDNRIYINDNLNPYYKELFWQARKQGKESAFKFVWINRGKILAKKDVGESAVVRINSFADLQKLI